MRIKYALVLSGFLFLADMVPGLSWGASPASAGPGLAPAADQNGITIIGSTGITTVVTATGIAKLPIIKVDVSFGTDHGPFAASFEGPLLWTVLDRTLLLGTGKPGAQVRQVVVVTGRDGYTAVLALGEIAPAFEGKKVILAEWMNGQNLGPGHFRIIVPGDRRGGRDVRDVVKIVVITAASMAKAKGGT